ncbi:hypothetical protein AK830_g240 [Neonectria ditissima]|uniref:Uncharacterized protein n=1 Tax=Neonectria ditissima TaxID=78410 RepID=A0A0N8H945_9HYPO|nr:hypothetical protein AK830_g240 [Neonectria ditissima]
MAAINYNSDSTTGQRQAQLLNNQGRPSQWHAAAAEGGTPLPWTLLALCAITTAAPRADTPSNMVHGLLAQ